MAQGPKVKARLEELQTLKGATPSASEARTAVGACRAVAESPEAGPELQAVMVGICRELESPATQTDTARREALMARLGGLALRFS